MNNNMGIPEWAEKVLEKPSVFDLAEYQVLRAFYEAWEHLHSLPNDRLHRKDAEQAAQKIVEQAHLLREMDKGKKH